MARPTKSVVSHAYRTETTLSWSVANIACASRKYSAGVLPSFPLRDLLHRDLAGQLRVDGEEHLGVHPFTNPDLPTFRVPNRADDVHQVRLLVEHAHADQNGLAAPMR